MRRFRWPSCKHTGFQAKASLPCEVWAQTQIFAPRPLRTLEEWWTHDYLFSLGIFHRTLTTGPVSFIRRIGNLWHLEVALLQLLVAHPEVYLPEVWLESSQLKSDLVP